MNKQDINKFYEIMEEYGVSKSDQMKIITQGIYFDFTYGDPDPTGKNCHLNFVQVGKLFKASKALGLTPDIDTLMNKPYDYKPEELVIIISKLCI